jgi:acylphosphatase
VFFRDTLLTLAERNGVAGWACNTPEGTVEAVLEGDDEAVARLIAFARKGPEGARVERVDEHSEQPQGLSGFSIR